MSDGLILMAEPRTVLGKQVKALRRQGLVPGVIYGPAVEQTIQLSIKRRELERFYMAHGHATLFSLQWEGGSQQVFLKELQVDPVSRAPLHADFFAPNLRKEITAGVPVVLHGLDAHAGGVLNQVLAEVQVRALPATLPHQIDADISKLLHSHDALHAGDLILPEGVALITDPEALVASLVALAGEPEAEEAAEAEDAATTEEGAADEAAADAAGDASES